MSRTPFNPDAPHGPYKSYRFALTLDFDQTEQEWTPQFVKDVAEGQMADFGVTVNDVMEFDGTFNVDLLYECLTYLRWDPNITTVTLAELISCHTMGARRGAAE